MGNKTTLAEIVSNRHNYNKDCPMENRHALQNALNQALLSIAQADVFHVGSP